MTWRVIVKAAKITALERERSTGKDPLNMKNFESFHLLECARMSVVTVVDS